MASKLRAMIAAPGVHVAQFPEPAKACTDAGHFMVAKPGKPARTPALLEKQRALLLTSIALGLEEDFKMAPVLGAIQGVVHSEKWPRSFFDAPGPSRDSMDVHFNQHTPLLEQHFGGDRKFPTGQVTQDVENHQKVLVDTIAQGRKQHFADEAERRRVAAEDATRVAR